MIIRSSYHFTGLGYSSLTRTKDNNGTIYWLATKEVLGFSQRIEDRELKKKFEEYFQTYIIPEIIKNP
jgi:hypothetical protein